MNNFIIILVGGNRFIMNSFIIIVGWWEPFYNEQFYNNSWLVGAVL